MDAAPSPSRRGRRPALSDDDRVVVGEIAREHPYVGADTLAKLFNARMDRDVSDNSVRYAMVAMGWRRKDRPPAEPVSPVPKPKDPHRYQDRHRTEGPAGRARSYPSDVSDTEWARVAPLLHGSRGVTPEPEQQRAKFDAILYIARTGCPWRYLPHDFPPWNTVAKTFYRWVERGVWARIQDTLRRQIRVAAGREEEPSAAIIDSQSVKTAEKGGSVASTPAKRSKAASGTSSSIPSGS